MGVSDAGYVYVYGGEGMYKIGRAANPQSRVRRFPLMPFEAKILYVIATNKMTELETQLHALFRESSLRGEWFKLTPSDLDMLVRKYGATPPNSESVVAARPLGIYFEPDILAILDELADGERRSRSQMVAECILRVKAWEDAKRAGGATDHRPPTAAP
jgi:hypothetical protein